MSKGNGLGFGWVTVAVLVFAASGLGTAIGLWYLQGAKVANTGPEMTASGNAEPTQSPKHSIANVAAPLGVPVANSHDAKGGLQLQFFLRPLAARGRRLGNSGRTERRQGDRADGLAADAVRENNKDEVVSLVIQLKNVGGRPVVTAFSLRQPQGAVKFMLRNADGSEIPGVNCDGEWVLLDESQVAPDAPLSIMVLAPGQVYEQEYMQPPSVRPLKKGKYLVSAYLEDQPRPEILPGISAWSGRLQSEEVEWTYDPEALARALIRAPWIGRDVF